MLPAELQDDVDKLRVLKVGDQFDYVLMVEAGKERRRN